MFVFKEFSLENYTIQLVMPEEHHAEELFNIVNNDRCTLSRWMPWTETTNSIEDEKRFLNYSRIQYAKYELFMTTILVNGIPGGMVDLHNINKTNRTAEFGYWLSSEHQGHGIMSKSVKQMLNYAFDDLKLHKVILQTDSENTKSIEIANRLGFSLEAILKDQIFYDKQFKDLNIFAKFANSKT